MAKPYSKYEAGLTLVEIMVVLIILGVLYATFGKKVFSAGARAKAEATMLKMKQVKGDIEQFNLRYNSLPGSLQDLLSCNEKTGSNCIPISDEETLKDAWNNPFVYRLDGSGRSYQIISLGADGRDGGSGVDNDLREEGP